MQTLGYIRINNENLLLLVRQKKYSRLLKIRNSGKLGNHFIDEENYLKENINDLTSLKNGNVIDL
ncbi:hypothetical protein ES704_03648 [subsurface metagenome]|jgi:hypothetical protein